MVVDVDDSVINSSAVLLGGDVDLCGNVVADPVVTAVDDRVVDVSVGTLVGT